MHDSRGTCFLLLTSVDWLGIIKQLPWGCAKLIYTDGIHLISDESRDELYTFAVRLGLRKEWIHETPGRPHYDLITPQILAHAIHHGATRLKRREFVAALRRNPEYRRWKAEGQS